MPLPPTRSGGLLTAALALACLVVCACTQNAPATSPPPAPPAAEAVPQPTATPNEPPRNAEPRSPRNAPMPVPTPEPAPAAVPIPESEPVPTSPLVAPLQAVPLAMAAPVPAPRPHVPRWMLYAWFFEHIVYLDRLADQVARPPISDELRRRDQVALGLTDSQAEILKEAAHDCIRTVEDLSARFSAASAVDSNMPATRDDRLGRLASAMIVVIETHVADLRTPLGPDVCDRIDFFVRRVYGMAELPPRTMLGTPGVPAPASAPPAMIPPQPRPPSNPPDASPLVPRWILYGWYFQRLVSLDRMAEGQGIVPLSAYGSGLTDRQLAAVREAAHDCIRVIEELSARLAASNARPPGNEQLGKIAAAMIQTIEKHVADLRSQLEPVASNRLDSDVHGLYSLVGYSWMSATTVRMGPPLPPSAPVPFSPAPLPAAPMSPPWPRNPPPSPAPTPAPNPPKPDEDAATVSVVAADPSLPGLLYVGTARGIYVNPTGSEAWSFCGGPLANASISALALGSGTTPEVFAATDGDGVFWSGDRGKTWTAIDGGLSRRSVSSLLFEDDDNGRILHAGTSAGVFRTTNRGGHWEQVSTGMTDARITALGSGAGAVYAGSSDGKLFKTTDRGLNWSEESLVPWSGAVHSIVSVAGTVFVATETGIFKKSDGDRSWSAADTGLPSVNLTALVVSRDDPPALYAVIREGIWKSVDAGASWILVHETSPSAFAISPGSGTRTFYAGVRGTILTSTNSGKSWKTTALKRPAIP